MSFSLIIPCYNYENLITQKYRQLSIKLKKINQKHEIIFVNDGSTDNTIKKLKLLKKKNRNIKILNNKSNIGKSFSLITGIKESKYEKIIIYDCDLPYLNYFEKVVKHLDNYSLVYINRKSKESKLNSRSLNSYQLSRFIIGRLMCFLVNFFCLDLNTGDTQAGLKAFIKPKKFKNIIFKSKKFFFDAEIMIIFHNLKKKMKYIPVKYSVPKDSTIKLFELKNFIYIYELLKVIIFYNIINIKKYEKLF
jgi:glycosyltransferase involved in cell wall biosynthesis